MAYIGKTILLILVASNILGRASWIDVNNESDFNKALSAKTVSAVFFYDSASCGFCKKYLYNNYDDLLNDSVLIEHKLNFIRVDIGNAQSLKARYGLEKKSHLLFLVNDIKSEMENYHENQLMFLEKKMSSADLVDDIKTFLYKKLLNLSVEIQTMDHFTKLLVAKGILIVYLGDKNSKFKIYDRITKINAGEEYYHVFNKNLKQQLLLTFNLEKTKDMDFVAAFRDHRSLIGFETNKVEIMEVTNSDISLEKFIEFERHPKLRGPEFAKKNVNAIMKQGQQMLLYVRSSPVNLLNGTHFKDAVKKMPKRFIFAYVDPKSDQNHIYEDLFKKADVDQRQESLYMIYKLPTKKIMIETYKGDFNAESIINFVFDFFKQKGYIFGQDHEEYIKEHLKPLDTGSDTR